MGVSSRQRTERRLAIIMRACAWAASETPPRCYRARRRTIVSDATEAAFQHARDMQRLAAGAVVDLVTTRSAVRHDDGVGGRLADCGQKREFPHGERHIDGIGVVAE